MVFNDTTNKRGLIQRYERHSQLGDGVVSGDTDFLKVATVDINETIYQITNEIILADDGFEFDDQTKTDYPVATTPLIAGRRDYQFDSISFLKLKRLDVSWDGAKYYRARSFDSGSYADGLGNDDTVDANFNRTEPRYDLKSVNLWLYPRATATDVSNGGKIRLEYTRAYTEFEYTDLTKEPPIDRPFHDLIAIGAALRNPDVTADQYVKLEKLFGVKRPDGIWTGGMGQVIAHYGSRDEEEQLVFNPYIQDYN